MTARKQKKDITRREALRRLGLAVTTAYVVPSVTMVSEARASTSSVSTVTPPTPPTAPSNIDSIERGVTAQDECKSDGSFDASSQATISAKDFEQAQAAVDAGYAKPLDDIWVDFNAAYSGKVIGIEFTGFRWRPRFRFKAISASGRLETVIVSARTGEIEKIIGC